MSYHPIDLRAGLVENVSRDLKNRVTSLRLQETQKNAIKMDISIDRLEVKLSAYKTRKPYHRHIHCASRSCTALNIRIFFAPAPTVRHAMKRILEAVEECWLDLYLCQVQAFDPVFERNDILRVLPLQHLNSYWLQMSHGMMFVLNLPKCPTAREWEAYSNKCAFAPSVPDFDASLFDDLGRVKAQTFGSTATESTVA